MEKINIFKIISIFHLLLNCQVQCRVNIKLVNLQCKSLDLKVGDFEKCVLKAVRRDVTEISVYFKLLKAVNNTSISLKVIKRGYSTVKPIYQYRVDLCEFFRNKRRNPVAEIFYNMFGLTTYSNMNHTCPYDHDLIVDHCRLDTKILNMLSIGQGEYTIATIFFIEHKPSVAINCSVRVY